MTVFYLGTHLPSWLASDRMDAKTPVFVSDVRLRDRKKLQKSIRRWACDSGGFSEISMNGRWLTTKEQYCERVARYDRDIGMLDWAAPQDWMCEPFILEKTGLTVKQHQNRTVQSFLDLESLWTEHSDEECPFMPVLQGFRIDEYHYCCELYAAAGVDLTTFEVVGVGSVCRRQAMSETGEVFKTLYEAGFWNLHGFGLKMQGLRKFGKYLQSADSMAWSFAARREPALPECVGLNHKNCANCITYAAKWYRRVMAIINQQREYSYSGGLPGG